MFVDVDSLTLRATAARFFGSVNDFSGPRALPFITFLDLSLRDSFNFNGLSFNQLVGLGQVIQNQDLIIDVTNLGVVGSDGAGGHR